MAGPSPSSGTGRTKTVLANPLRFVRVKYTVAADAYMTAAIEAVARST